MKQKLENIAINDARFDPNALRFVYEGLSYTVKNLTDQPGHISGRTLCMGLKQMALEKYGRLAKLVLNCWGINSTRDFGEVVYLMIENEWMSSQPTDNIEDFDDVFDFQQAFKDNYSFNTTNSPD